jgi:hypothetical protein
MNKPKPLASTENRLIEPRWGDSLWSPKSILEFSIQNLAFLVAAEALAKGEAWRRRMRPNHGLFLPVKNWLKPFSKLSAGQFGILWIFVFYRDANSAGPGRMQRGSILGSVPRQSGRLKSQSIYHDPVSFGVS